MKKLFLLLWLLHWETAESAGGSFCLLNVTNYPIEITAINPGGFHMAKRYRVDATSSWVLDEDWSYCCGEEKNKSFLGYIDPGNGILFDIMYNHSSDKWPVIHFLVGGEEFPVVLSQLPVPDCLHGDIVVKQGTGVDYFCGDHMASIALSDIQSELMHQGIPIILASKSTVMLNERSLTVDVMRESLGIPRVRSLTVIDRLLNFVRRLTKK